MKDSHHEPLSENVMDVDGGHSVSRQREPGSGDPEHQIRILEDEKRAAERANAQNAEMVKRLKFRLETLKSSLSTKQNALKEKESEVEEMRSEQEHLSEQVSSLQTKQHESQQKLSQQQKKLQSAEKEVLRLKRRIKIVDSSSMGPTSPRRAGSSSISGSFRTLQLSPRQGRTVSSSQRPQELDIPSEGHTGSTELPSWILNQSISPGSLQIPKAGVSSGRLASKHSQGPVTLSQSLRMPHSHGKDGQEVSSDRLKHFLDDLHDIKSERSELGEEYGMEEDDPDRLRHEDMKVFLDDESPSHGGAPVSGIPPNLRALLAKSPISVIDELIAIIQNGLDSAKEAQNAQERAERLANQLGATVSREQTLRKKLDFANARIKYLLGNLGKKETVKTIYIGGDKGGSRFQKSFGGSDLVKQPSQIDFAKKSQAQDKQLAEARAELVEKARGLESREKDLANREILDKQNMKDLEDEKQRLEDEKHALEEEWEKIEEERKLFSDEKTSLQQEIDTLKAQLSTMMDEDLSEECGDYIDQITELQAQKSAFDKENADLHKSLMAELASLETDMEDSDAEQRERSELEAEIAKIEARKAELEKDRVAREEAERARLEKLKDAEEQLAEDKEELDRKRAELEADQAALVEKIRALAEREEEEQRKLDELEDERKKIEEARQTFVDDEQKLSELESEHKQIEEERDELAAKQQELEEEV
ncbi:hypothetical protein ADUPG1_007206, partial [Aduncisulcus paluster]